MTPFEVIFFVLWFIAFIVAAIVTKFDLPTAFTMGIVTLITGFAAVALPLWVCMLVVLFIIGAGIVRIIRKA